MLGDAIKGVERLQARCCIAGGGPAGMMLGYLLARAGIDIIVLEKHADFLRDFRGDTIHPSTLDVLYELGILDAFLALPHQELKQIRGYVGGREFTFADFSCVPTRCRFIALLPQWDFLNFIAKQAHRYPTFQLRMQADVTELIEEDDHVVGLRATTPTGPLEVRAELTVGADGRHSVVRSKGRLVVDDIGAPIDVLWMRISRRPSDPGQLLGRFDRGRILVMINRGEYWQCGFVIRKGGYDEVRKRGLAAFHEDIVRLAPFLRDHVSELNDWNNIKLLTVMVDRLRKWHRPGLLCIGDAAHAMSPVGGVGINLAIQDAVATANLLTCPLRSGQVTSDALELVQRRRELPTRLTQRLQVFIQKRFIYRVLSNEQETSLPWFIRVLLRIPLARRLPAYFVGIGFRPEHVQTTSLES